ncbi:hypothetical protein [Nostoc parmelioides]|uniref:Uncharacterized protein n=1 Tax=Nostoc parmelioides FACHB-3921 TaxID=2692909 RepID=A0ABR8BPJ7_9NOSO|nr:hypothetical protein [Nostoc parmelioides]MBD2255465.1 hypothetical protein [Nostoc parmelioides FACHB-3921]
MDVSILTTFLVPFLPYLLKAGEKATEEAGKKVGEKFGGDAWEKAKSLWAKLSPKVEAKAAAIEAASDVAKDPEDKDALAALRLQLKKLLNEDSTLASEIVHLFEEAKQTGSVSNVIASGERAVALGSNASGNTISTGDNVTHNQSKTTNP